VKQISKFQTFTFSLYFSHDNINFPNFSRFSRFSRSVTTLRIYSASPSTQTLLLSVPSLSSENSGKISEMWPFSRESLLTLSFSQHRPNTKRARERGFSRLPTHAERLMKQSHLLHVTVPLSRPLLNEHFV